jgi:putative Flp pilus-assembly TadE/G-like protein
VILAILGAILVALLGFTALAVDVANGYVVRGILQHAVDDAALTAQRWSAQVDDPGVDPAAVQAQAMSAALDTARRDIQAQGLASVTVVDAAVAGSRLRIAARASIRTWFLGALGIASWLPSASSDVALWTAAAPGTPSSGAVAPSASPAPTFPPVAGPVPIVILPERPAGPGSGGQPGGAGPEPAPPGGTSADSPAPASGGEIVEGNP